MNLPFQITLNSVLMILIGLSLIAFGVWLITKSGTRIHAAGFLFTGFGNILFGITNGFTNMTSLGRKLYRIALITYIIGIPVIIYFLYQQMSSI
jgi:hypothetical protein